ncbi:MAG: WD40 repeat domain-containing protein, partial [Planctomycetota bacterium]
TAATYTHRTLEVRSRVPGRAPLRAEHEPFLRAPALSADGSLALVIANMHPDKREPHEWFLYDTRTGEALKKRKDIEFDALTATITPDKKLGLVGDRRGGVRVLDLETGECRVSYMTVERVHGLAYLDAKKGTWLSGGGNRGLVTIGDTGTDGPTILQPIGSHEASILAVAGCPRLALTGDAKGHVKLWDVPRKSAGGDLGPDHKKPITALAVTSDGKVAVVASEDGTIDLWDLERVARFGTIDLATSSDHPTALLFEGPRLLRVGTARGVVHGFEILK